MSRRHVTDVFVDERRERPGVGGLTARAAGAPAQAPGAASYVQVQRRLGPAVVLRGPVELPEHLPHPGVRAGRAQVRAQLQLTAHPIALADADLRAAGGVPEELRTVAFVRRDARRHLGVHGRARPPGLQRAVLALADAHRQGPLGCRRRGGRGALGRRRRGRLGGSRAGRQTQGRGDGDDGDGGDDALADERPPRLELCSRTRRRGGQRAWNLFPINYIRTRGAYSRISHAVPKESE